MRLVVVCVCVIFATTELRCKRARMLNETERATQKAFEMCECVIVVCFDSRSSVFMCSYVCMRQFSIVQPVYDGKYKFLYVMNL